MMTCCVALFLLQCAAVVKLDGEVGCMINEGPWIFVGILNNVKVIDCLLIFHGCLYAF